MKETWYVGLDAHSRSSTVVIQNEDGEVVYEKDSFSTCKEEFVKHLSHPDKNVRVHLEASNICEHVGDLIEDLVQEVIVSDPRKNDLVAKTGGGDRTDAYQLARLLRLDGCNPIHREKSIEKRIYRDAFLEYVRINKDQARLKQRTQLLLQKWGLHNNPSTKIHTPEARTRLLERVEIEQLKFILKDRFQELSLLLEKKQKAKQRVVMLEDQFPIIKKYRKMPGGGFFTANGFVAKVINPFRFKTRKQLHKYARLAVISSESAEKKKGASRLNKAGHGLLKQVLYRVFTGALSTKEENGISRFYKITSKKSINGNAAARLNTMRKICDVMWSMWKNNNAYDDDRLTHPDDPLGS